MKSKANENSKPKKRKHYIILVRKIKPNSGRGSLPQLKVLLTQYLLLE